jgi:hypothetical protein
MRQGGADDIPDDDGLRDDGCRRRRPDRRPDCPAGCGHARHQSGKDQTVATGRRVSRGVEADRQSAGAVADSEIIRDRLEKPRPLVACAVDHAPAIRRSCNGHQPVLSHHSSPSLGRDRGEQQPAHGTSIDRRAAFDAVGGARGRAERADPAGAARLTAQRVRGQQGNPSCMARHATSAAGVLSRRELSPSEGAVIGQSLSLLSGAGRSHVEHAGLIPVMFLRHISGVYT